MADYDFAVTVVGPDAKTHVTEYGTVYGSEKEAAEAARRKLERNPWAIFAHVRVILGDSSDVNAATAKLFTVWPE